MTKCARCERLPESAPAAGRLFLVPPIAPTCAIIEDVLERLSLEYITPFPQVYEIPFGEGDLRRLCEEYGETISALEQADTKCFILPRDEALSVAHLATMEPLRVLVARIRAGWLTDMLAQKRLTSWFQPIADKEGVIHGHECLMRGIGLDGAIISPIEIYNVARQSDLLFFLDCACRINAVRCAAEHGVASRLFINFVPASIYRPEACLQSTFQAISDVGLQPENIVFEVVESETVRDTEHLLRVLSFYRDHGFKVALDDLGAGYSSLNLLSRLQPDYIKLDMALVRDVDVDPYKANITENLLNMAQKLGVRSVAEGVETQGELHWLLEHGADLLQGFLLGHPAPEPASSVNMPA
ncbi:EAL domain-containing protein [Oceanidesulfovibrio marinus]|uniref:EAL domain-containing protein n=1 Tax=Oceanidesulfovibrio marinus TaxID=370038 RepID=A0A6P1ZDA9_9BACT|nr:EAL domain-containing protein [Oceanidesulfovibrio marinus]TVM32326.1 EAL domain-containing protein [Oceanidesulfovibrio marinus]